MAKHQTPEPPRERATVDRPEDRYSMRYDPSMDIELTSVVVDALADVAGVDPVEIPPLSDVVDPDAMNALFRPKPDGTPRTRGQLTFTHFGHEVVVEGEGRIEIAPNGSA